MIGLGLAVGRSNDANPFTEADKSILCVSELGHRNRPDPQNLETSPLVSSRLSPVCAEPLSQSFSLCGIRSVCNCDILLGDRKGCPKGHQIGHSPAKGFYQSSTWQASEFIGVSYRAHPFPPGVDSRRQRPGAISTACRQRDMQNASS